MESIHLDRLAEIIALPFGLYYRLVDLARCDVMVPGQCGKQITLVVAQIQVHLESKSARVRDTRVGSGHCTSPPSSVT